LRGKHFARILTFLLLASAGCTQTIKRYVRYEPMAAPAKIASDKSTPVAVDVIDKRSNTTILSETDGILGEVTYKYVPYSDMAQLLKGAFQTELKDRGLTVGPGGNTVDVTISFIRADDLHTSGPGRTVASIGLEVTVNRADGTTAYSRFILGQNGPWQASHPPKDPEYQTTNAVEASIQDTLSNVFADPAFLNALTNQQSVGQMPLLKEK
jgi:uncharacterized lipoprotein YajG